MRRRRLAGGGVFVVATGEGRIGVGQVVATGEHAQLFFLAVFEEVLPEEVLADGAGLDRVLGALRSPVLLLGESMDAKVAAGHWTVVARAPVAEQVRLPAYKIGVGFPPSWEVLDHTGTKRRPATALEVELLPYRKVVSPMYFEVALKAHLGLAPWHEAFDAIRPRAGVSSADLFG